MTSATAWPGSTPGECVRAGFQPTGRGEASSKALWPPFSASGIRPQDGYAPDREASSVPGVFGLDRQACCRRTRSAPRSRRSNAPGRRMPALHCRRHDFPHSLVAGSTGPRAGTGACRGSPGTGRSGPFAAHRQRPVSLPTGSAAGGRSTAGAAAASAGRRPLGLRCQG